MIELTYMGSITQTRTNYLKLKMHCSSFMGEKTKKIKTIERWSLFFWLLLPGPGPAILRLVALCSPTERGEVGGRIPPPLPGAEEGGGVRLQRSKFWVDAPPAAPKFRDTAKGLLINASFSCHLLSKVFSVGSSPTGGAKK